jgi:hypothetical protein
MKPLKRITGKSHYVSERDSNRGAVWGLETFTITEAKDGVRTLQAHCELELDGLHVVRQISQSVHADWHPNEGHARLLTNGEFAGSAWYRFTDHEVECEAYTLKEGRLSQRFPLNRRPMRGLGTHALQADGWNVAVLDYAKGPHHEQFHNNIMISIHHLGATGPKIEVTTSGLQYYGDENVTTPAGTFRCHKVAYVGMVTNDHPPYMLWVTADGAFIFVKGVVEGYMASRFELVDLSVEG